MKVKELIAKLQLLDQDASVIVCSSNFELRHANVDVSFVHQYNTALKKTCAFTDGFDYGRYDKDTWSMVGGTNKAVYIS